MWILRRTDLKYLLTLRIVAVAAFCFAATAAYVLFDADRSARARIDAVAALAARDLELQHSKLDWVKVNGRPAGSPVLAADVGGPASTATAQGTRSGGACARRPSS